VVKKPTPKQSAVLLALGGHKKSAEEVAADLAISTSAVRGRLNALWQKGLGERTWSRGLDRWYAG